MKARKRINEVPDVIDQVVEDLAQQDVMPAGAGDDAMPDAEADMGFEQAESWNEAVGGQPHQAKRSKLEDETSASELLVQRGVTEAADELGELDAEESRQEAQEEESE
jgi:hypothetical protein